MASKQVLAEFQPLDHDHRQCVADAIRHAEEVCRRRGQRMTPLRRRVLELVWQRHAPAGAYDLLEDLRKQHRNAQPPTVYRALDFLRENGLVHRIESLNAYLGCPSPERKHSGQFLICRECRSVAELDDTAIREIVNERAARLGFHVETQTIEILGVCPLCQ